MKIYNIKFAQNLQKQLLLNEMTQAQLAERLGVTPAAVNYWCNAERSPATLELFYKLCDVLNCSMSDLVGNFEELPEGAIASIKLEKQTLTFAKVLQADQHRLEMAKKLFDIADEDLPRVSAILDIFTRGAEK